MAFDLMESRRRILMNTPHLVEASGDIATFATDMIAPLKSCVVTINPVQSGTGDPSPDNVRPISGWSAVNVWVKPTYDPTADPTATIQLGQTVYGGTLSLNRDGSGTLAADHVSKIIHSSNVTGVQNATGYAMVLLESKGVLVNGYGLCNVFVKYNGSASSIPAFNFRVIDSSGYNRGQMIFKCDFSSSTAPEQRQKYKDYIDSLEANGIQVQIVYKLVNPVTYTIPASDMPSLIKTLRGTNNIWADCGPVEVKFWKH